MSEITANTFPADFLPRASHGRSRARANGDGCAEKKMLCGAKGHVNGLYRAHEALPGDRKRPFAASQQRVTGQRYDSVTGAATAGRGLHAWAV